MKEESHQGTAAITTNIGTILGTIMALLTCLSIKHPKRNKFQIVPASLLFAIKAESLRRAFSRERPGDIPMLQLQECKSTTF